jgi:hypothetical protein
MNHRQMSAPSRGAERNVPSQPEKGHVREDLVTYIRRYAQEQPENFAMACFGIGFVLGWKLKPW